MNRFYVILCVELFLLNNHHKVFSEIGTFSNVNVLLIDNTDSEDFWCWQDTNTLPKGIIFLHFFISKYVPRRDLSPIRSIAVNYA